MTPVSATEDVAALWLGTLQRAIARASHDVKDALNGVSVNLEVIRGRAARPDTPAAAVAAFAEASAHQLDRLTNLIEAVLALGRAERQPADVVVTLRRLAALCGASTSAADADVLVEQGDVETAATSVPGDAVRLALAAPMLALVVGSDRGERATPVRCVVQAVDGGTAVTLSASGRRAVMPESVADAVRAAGVRWGEAGQGPAAGGPNDLSLVFPRA
jgi:signal transduction histidine kinase